VLFQIKHGQELVSFTNQKSSSMLWTKDHPKLIYVQTINNCLTIAGTESPKIIDEDAICVGWFTTSKSVMRSESCGRAD
jgi:hypothetical protein